MVSFRYSTRLVLVLNNIVIKFPLSKRGYLQGINEQKIWNKYKGIAPLAELKWMWMGVVCQKRYATVDTIPKYKVDNIKQTIPELNFHNCDLHNFENWGSENGKYILLDYGNNPYIASLYKK